MTRFQNYTIEKRYQHIIGNKDGSYKNNFHELLECVGHSDMSSDDRTELIGDLLSGATVNIGDYDIRIDLTDTNTVESLREDLAHEKKLLEGKDE